ncbi:WD repeat domain-containing protein 83-like [Tachypleus tridentatus]|uniref:WD repeat domain-containing protein 83-like n=1 Tax=Tachypleus tridentatus TaxID=6853 RepID=UPI003FD5DA58
MSHHMYQFKVVQCGQGAVRCVRFNADGNYCLTCGSDKSLKLWNPKTEKLLQKYSGHGYEVLDAQGSCDNSHIVSGSMDKHVFLWDVITANPIRKFRGHAGKVNAVKFNEESSIVLSASIDGTLRAWDCRSRNKDPVQIMNEATDSVTCLDVSSQEILSGSLDCKIRCYDLRKGEIRTDYLGNSITSVSFTKDSQCILASCLDSTLKLIDKNTGELLNEYQGHKNVKYHIDSCLSNDDSSIYSGSEDGTVYCWDLIDKKLQKLHHEGSKVVHSLSFHPTNICLLTAAEDSIFLWQV